MIVWNFSFFGSIRKHLWSFCNVTLSLVVLPSVNIYSSDISESKRQRSDQRMRHLNSPQKMTRRAIRHWHCMTINLPLTKKEWCLVVTSDPKTDNWSRNLAKSKSHPKKRQWAKLISYSKTTVWNQRNGTSIFHPSKCQNAWSSLRFWIKFE